jgi:hypothetical protein
MYSLKVVEAACGPKLAQYVKNKAKGGAAVKRERVMRTVSRF